MTRRAKLTVTNGSQQGEAHYIQDDIFQIGRNTESDVVLNDPTVSRKHATIRHYDGSYYLQDLQSSGGIWLNNVRINAEKLASGDRIQIGKTILTFDLVEHEAHDEPDVMVPIPRTVTPPLELPVVPQDATEDAYDMDGLNPVKNVLRLTIQMQEPEPYERRVRPIGYLHTPPYRPPLVSSLTPIALVVGAIAIAVVAVALIAVL